MKFFLKKKKNYTYVRIYENGTKAELEPKPGFQWTFRPSLGPVNGQKIERGGQWKEDKRVEEEKKHWLGFYNFYIVDFGEKYFWREINARLGREFNFLAPFS